MTDIEQKALALIKPGATCEVNLENISILAIALTRAIEQHEAFRQEVSDAATEGLEAIDKAEFFNAAAIFSRFIIAKPDPLAELDKIMRDAGVSRHVREEVAERIASGGLTIEKRGGEIVWERGDD